MWIWIIENRQNEPGDLHSRPSMFRCDDVYWRFSGRDSGGFRSHMVFLGEQKVLRWVPSTFGVVRFHRKLGDSLQPHKGAIEHLYLHNDQEDGAETEVPHPAWEKADMSDVIWITLRVVKFISMSHTCVKKRHMICVTAVQRPAGRHRMLLNRWWNQLVAKQKENQNIQTSKERSSVHVF